MPVDLIDKRDEKIWDKAVDAFTKQYKKEPKNDRDYSIVASIFQKLGGRFNHDEKMLEKFCEELKMNDYKERLERLYESRNNLTSDENDVLEGIVMSNKGKSDDEILKIVKKDTMFRSVNDSALKQSIKDTKRMYRLEKLSEGVYKEELKVDSKYIQQLKQNNIDFEKVGDKLLVDESDSKVLDGLGIPYKESLSEAFKFTSPYDIQKFLKSNKNFSKEWSVEDMAAFTKQDVKDVKRLAQNAYAQNLVNYNNGKYSLLKESLLPLDKLYESVCKESVNINKIKQDIEVLYKSLTKGIIKPSKTINKQLDDIQKQLDSTDQSLGSKHGELWQQLQDFRESLSEGFKVGDRVVYKNPFGKTQKGVIEDIVRNKWAIIRYNNMSTSEVELTDIIKKESLSPLDRLYESVCKEASANNYSIGFPTGKKSFSKGSKFSILNKYGIDDKPVDTIKVIDVQQISDYSIRYTVKSLNTGKTYTQSTVKFRDVVQYMFQVLDLWAKDHKESLSEGFKVGDKIVNKKDKDVTGRVMKKVNGGFEIRLFADGRTIGDKEIDNRDLELDYNKESLSPLDKLYESVCKEAKWIDYKVIKKNFLGDVGDHVVIDWNAFDSPKWKNLTKGTSGSPVSADDEKSLKKI